jgi:hypothetical protein
MDILTGQSGKTFLPLPINAEQGFPQSFPLLFDGRTYHFNFYVNAAAHILAKRPEFIEVPTEEAFLVLRLEREVGDAAREVIFLRKIVPDLQYEAEELALFFTEQKIARDNLNGSGAHGTQVVGGIARRWV